MFQVRARTLLVPPPAFALLLGLLLPIVATPAAEADGSAPTAAEKSLVTDGSFVHNVGRLWCNVTNWGLVGSQYGAAAPYADAPSCMWPGGSGVDYLWSGGLWVGARVLGERRVSTGQYTPELRATADPLDTMYRSSMGAPGGHRYPEPLPDDDGDGAEDEDPLDGLDNDGDGLVDEDYAAIGEQCFRCTLNDTTAAAVYPDHEPLGISIVQESCQWSEPLYGDAFVLDYTIRNTGPRMLDDVYVGFFADCDIGARGRPGLAADDLAGFWQGMVSTSDGGVEAVSLGYMFDEDGDGGTAPGYLGIVPLDHPTDPAGIAAPTRVGIRSFQIFRGDLAFGQGGDPTNDSERYAVMSVAAHDNDLINAADGRILCASGPFAALAPGQELRYRVALVVGGGLNGARQQAAEMLRLFRGAAFDRDGDPTTGEDGRETVVHWLRPADVPVPALRGELTALHEESGASLRWACSLVGADRLAVVRQAAGGNRRFAGADLGELAPDAGGARGSFRDADDVGWPRLYRLVLEPGPVTLAQARLEGPPATSLRLTAWPNPANPRLSVRFAAPAGAEVRLAVHDVRGRLVRVLCLDTPVAGSGEVLWDGLDAEGRPAPSGSYELRLEAGGRGLQRRVTLVR